MDRRITDALERHPQVHDWTVRRQRGAGAQTYLAGSSVEAVRQVERESYEIHVYRDHELDGEPMRGSATIPLGCDEIERVDAVVDEAVVMAGLIHNRPWSLPEPMAHPPVELADPALSTPEAATRAARDAVDRIRGLTDGVAGVRLSAAELFVTQVDEEIANSRGLHGEARSTRILLELVLLADGEEEAEWVRQAEARRLEDLHLPELVTAGVTQARDATRARIPRTRTGPVVISSMALEQLLSGGVVGAEGAYIVQTGAEAAHAGLTRLQVGESAYLGREPTGDLLTMRANARHPFGVLSYRFDADGLAAQDVPLIRDGILVARTATQRYAQYLGLPATGRAGMMEMAPGPTPFADLLADDGPVIHVLAFSAANVDAVTGNFGMEIRVGYEVGPGGTTPVRGGSVGGNLLEAMASARFSSETAVDKSTAGPQAIRFESIQVAGEDD